MAENHTKEIPPKAFTLYRHFSDAKGIIKPKAKGRCVDVEVDIFCEKPLVAAELTWTLGSGMVH